MSMLGDRRGVALTIRKGLPLASGLGGSAASAAAAVVAVDALLNAHTPRDVLIACALEGEKLGAGSAHPDNVAPSICRSRNETRFDWDSWGISTISFFSARSQAIS